MPIEPLLYLNKHDKLCACKNCNYKCYICSVLLDTRGSLKARCYCTDCDLHFCEYHVFGDSNDHVCKTCGFLISHSFMGQPYEHDCSEGSLKPVDYSKTSDQGPEITRQQLITFLNRENSIRGDRWVILPNIKDEDRKWIEDEYHYQTEIQYCRILVRLP